MVLVMIELNAPNSILKTNVTLKNLSKTKAQIFVFASTQKKEAAEVLAKAPAWKKENLKSELGKDWLHFETDQGLVNLVTPKSHEGPVSHSGQLEESKSAQMRDIGGLVWTQIKNSGLDSEVIIGDFDATMIESFFVGLEMAGYSFKVSQDFEKPTWPKVSVRSFKKTADEKLLKQTFESAVVLGEAINWARHLVNAPPNYLNPTSYAALVKKHWRADASMKIEIWDEKRLIKEKMGLHLAVGAGSPNAPCLVHLSYRPKKKSKQKPVAFVGKGITFDTGGLDIKPSSGMRLMKKDMGGSAAVLGLAKWVSASQYAEPCDFYLALAENSIDGKSFRPSDVIQSRQGHRVEIHNTDAEGRLVLADALHVAVTQKNKEEPEHVIDVATLTGAIKVALGTEISGLFSNDDRLAEQLQKAGQQAGDLNWRMPLYSRYTASFATPFADFVNATDGWAGAITAALFLEKFVEKKSWAHLDIYAWNDRASGALSFAGGSGQAVPMLVQYLRTRAQRPE
jgi:leucyl aminopeptidase